MARDLLNHLSDWLIGSIFIGGSIGIAFAGWVLVSRFLGGWREPESGDKVVGVAAMVMTLFALVLAFVVVNLDSGYESAAANVSAEASSLGVIIRDAQAFPTPDRRRIDAAVARYAAEVRGREFATLRTGHEDPQARRLLTGLFDAAQSYSPVTEAQRAFYRSAIDRLNAVADDRQKRLEAAETSIPGPLLALVIISALVTLATTLLLKTHLGAVDIALVASVAVIVGAGLFTALILEYPFSGSIAVSSGPFVQVAVR